MSVRAPSMAVTSSVLRVVEMLSRSPARTARASPTIGPETVIAPSRRATSSCSVAGSQRRSKRVPITWTWKGPTRTFQRVWARWTTETSSVPRSSATSAPSPSTAVTRARPPGARRSSEPSEKRIGRPAFAGAAIHAPTTPVSPAISPSGPLGGPQLEAQRIARAQQHHHGQHRERSERRGDGQHHAETARGRHGGGDLRRQQAGPPLRAIELRRGLAVLQLGHVLAEVQQRSLAHRVRLLREPGFERRPAVARRGLEAGAGAAEATLDGRQRGLARGGHLGQLHAVDEAEREGDALVGRERVQHRVGRAERVEHFARGRGRLHLGHLVAGEEPQPAPPAAAGGDGGAGHVDRDHGGASP